MVPDKIVELAGVSKMFGSTTILNDVNLQVQAGEFVSIRGKSGVGKTSLFKIIGLLASASSGSVCLFGKNVSSLKEAEKADLRLNRLGLVFQFFNLLPSLTVMENIELPMALAGLKKHVRQDRGFELLRYFGLESLAERSPESLSGGEKQRVAIIRALVNQPTVLLADEPTSSLDDENSILLVDLLSKISVDRKVAVIMTTTDLYDKLPTVKDYLLKDGHLYQNY
ncbi:MAG: ABC transporter ATP-binding protein [Candidatus Bathyarchaeia archaeon]|jgi:putative ABC transport system ATP-binding protein